MTWLRALYWSRETKKKGRGGVESVGEARSFVDWSVTDVNSIPCLVAVQCPGT